MARPPKKKEKNKKENPITAAVSSWLASLPPALLDALGAAVDNDDDDEDDDDDVRTQLLARAPKRWVVYEPMVLLPSGSFAAAPWPALLGAATPAQQAALWTAILRQLAPQSGAKAPLTHLAVNEGIPAHLLSGGDESPSPPPPPSPPDDTVGGKAQQQQICRQENVLRSPAGLRLLWGDFGPATHGAPVPTAADFEAALWVSTRQNGIYQTWAPRWTMFSRGNVKEKARLLSSFAAAPCPRPLSAHSQQQQWAVDLYAGIGYFAFSYARLGLRVLCWEVSAWSVEGLRRGAERNGWSVRVVGPSSSSPCPFSSPPPSRSPSSSPSVAAAETQSESEFMRELLSGPEQIVVFLEDNRLAAGRVRAARAAGVPLDVVHVNCGFLPSSERVWRDAWEIQTGEDGGGDGWLHLHENVGAEDVQRRKGEIQALFEKWQGEGEEEREKEKKGGAVAAKVAHVELVKTFAPGVWHCVFDVYITRSGAGE